MIEFEKIELEVFRSTQNFMNGTKFQKYRAIRKLRDPLIFYRRNYRSLNFQFRKAQIFLESEEFWSNRSNSVRWNIHKDLSTCLFNYLGAVGANIDLSKIAARKWLPVVQQKNLQKLLNEKFIDDISNRIIRKLRNIVMHDIFLNIGMVSSGNQNGQIHNYLYLNKILLLERNIWNKKERKYLKTKSGNYIEIVPMIQKYHNDFTNVQNKVFCLILKENIQFLDKFKSSLVDIIDENNRISKEFQQGKLLVRYLNYVTKKIR